MFVANILALVFLLNLSRRTHLFATRQKVSCITRGRRFSSSAQVCF